VCLVTAPSRPRSPLQVTLLPFLPAGCQRTGEMALVLLCLCLRPTCCASHSHLAWVCLSAPVPINSAISLIELISSPSILATAHPDERDTCWWRGGCSSCQPHTQKNTSSQRQRNLSVCAADPDPQLVAAAAATSDEVDMGLTFLSLTLMHHPQHQHRRPAAARA